MTRVLDEAVAQRHVLDPMTEQAAQVPDFLLELRLSVVGIVLFPEQQRMATDDADVLMTPVAIDEAPIDVVPKEALQRVADPGHGSVLPQVGRTAPAVSTLSRGRAKHAVVHVVSPQRAGRAEERAPQPTRTDHLGFGERRHRDTAG